MITLARSPTWHALLHYSNGRFPIQDKKFFLTKDAPTPKSELQEAIRRFSSGDKELACRFPARYLWLRQNINLPDISLAECKELQQFLRKAPTESISLVFASENINQPSSMLGHSFLKLTGKNSQGTQLEHAISFYTDANTINLPVLFYESIISGKQGFFSLMPYEQVIRRYVGTEQRTLWEYELDLTKRQQELIVYHLLELKNIDQKYYFHRYNCATVLHFALSLSDTRLPEEPWWTTPKDLIKQAQTAGLITSSHVIAPSRWLVRTLAGQLSHAQTERNADALTHEGVGTLEPTSTTPDGYLQLEHALALNQYLYLNDKLNKSTWLANDEKLTAYKNKYYPQYSLDLSDRFNPISTPQESQIGLSWRRRGRGNDLLLDVIPASHRLDDDNREYQHETSLRLFNPTLSISPQQGTVKLEQFTLFSTESLIPYRRQTGGVSGNLAIALRPQFDRDLNDHLTFVTEGGVGLAYRPHNDIDLYVLTDVGLGVKHGLYLYQNVTGGMVIRELGNLKGLLSYSRQYNGGNSGTSLGHWQFEQSWFIDKTDTLNLGWQQFRTDAHSTTVWQSGWRHLF